MTAIASGASLQPKAKESRGDKDVTGQALTRMEILDALRDVKRRHEALVTFSELSRIRRICVTLGLKEFELIEADLYKRYCPACGAMHDELDQMGNSFHLSSSSHNKCQLQWCDRDATHQLILGGDDRVADTPHTSDTVMRSSAVSKQGKDYTFWCDAHATGALLRDVDPTLLIEPHGD